MYPLRAADDSTILFYGHEQGLNVLRVYDAGRPDDSKERTEETDEAQSESINVEQWADISIDSPVTRIAFPPITASQASTDSSQLPDFLRSHVLVAVACADSSIRLISFPLARDAGRKRQDTKITVLNSPATHQDLISSLSLTWTTDQEHDDQTSSESDIQEGQSSFLVASASTTGSGLLVVHRVTQREHIGDNKEAYTLLTKQFVRLPLLGGTLAFNPSTNSPSKHTTLLLTSPAHGTVKVLSLVDANSSLKRRRGEDTAGKLDEASDTFSLRSLLSLYAPYHPSEVPERRKAVLDAKWTMQGKCIAVLLEDGEWGVWNPESLDSTSSSDRTGTKGATINHFAIRGSLSTATPSKKTAGGKPTDSIAPITPHTRKTRSAALFGSGDQLKDMGQQNPHLAGHITVYNEQASGLADESLILSYGECNAYIASLRSLWQAEVSGGAAFGRSSGNRVQRLPLVRLGGECQLSINKMPKSPGSGDVGLLGALDTSPDFLVVTDSRLVLYSKSRSKKATGSTSLNLPLRSIGNKETSFISRIANGETLDVDEMDDILESMGASEVHPISTTQGSVSLRGDDEPPSPLETASSKSKLMIEARKSVARQNLFG